MESKGIEILENLTREIREFWPEFEGFITVYYEGIFSTYQDKGVSGINLPDVDFYWKERNHRAGVQKRDTFHVQSAF